MDKIYEQIKWYEENSASLYDDVVRIELKKINELYESYEDCTNKIFVNEMIESFCKIIEKQRERIDELTCATAFSYNQKQSSGCGFMASQNGVTTENGYIPQKGFQTDKQLQEAFTVYCLNNGKSSYTVNDYCSRIKNLWKTFYEEYKNNGLPRELEIAEEKITPDSPLLNAYYHTDEINCYISMKIAAADGNRNWANIRAAFNKFDDFKEKNQ